MGFMTGQKIYDNFANGVGPRGLSESAAMVRALAEQYREEGAAIRALTAKMESVWRGNAAGAAQRGAGPLATEHELAAPHMGTAQDLNSRQAGSFTDARNAVVPVPPQPSAPDPWAALSSPGGVATYRQQVVEFNAANQHNVDVMTGYTAASTFNTAGMPESYGSIANDRAAMTVDSMTPSPNGGPPRSGPRTEEAARDAGRGVVEPPGRAPAWVATPATEPGSPGVAPNNSRVPQQTTPGGFTPTPAGPVPNGEPGGRTPGTGVPPVGIGPYDGSGGRDPAAGPGGRTASPPGPGSGAESPGRRVGGPFGSGSEARGRNGGEPHGAGRPGVSGGAGGRGGVPLGGGGRGRDEDDLEHRAPEFLRENDPEALFGTDELTPPAVIGEAFEPPDVAPTAG
jgi:hypothetical protein